MLRFTPSQRVIRAGPAEERQCRRLGLHAADAGARWRALRAAVPHPAAGAQLRLPYQLGHYEGADAPEDAMLMTLPVRAALSIAQHSQLPQSVLLARSSTCFW